MTKYPNDDERLVEFLRQHRPSVPPASPNLEQQIMLGASSHMRHQGRRQLWIVPPTIVAGLLMFWTGYRILTPSSPSVDTASLETFLVNNWDGVVGDTSVAPQRDTAEADWLTLANSKD